MKLHRWADIKAKNIDPERARCIEARARAELVAADVKAKGQTLLCNDLVPKRGLQVFPSRFECPYCGHSAPRGGHAEGFRKSGMSNHVFICWEILLFRAGYVVGNYVGTEVAMEATDPPQSDDGRVGELAVTVEDLESGAAKWFNPKRVVRALRANVRSRARAGLDPKGPR